MATHWAKQLSLILIYKVDKSRKTCLQGLLFTTIGIIFLKLNYS